jgi:hypothetical protein
MGAFGGWDVLIRLVFGLKMAGWRRFYPQWSPGETFPEMHDLQEAYEMITNRFEEWKERQRLVGVQQGVEQDIERGIERGRLEGERALVLRQIQHRFGELPATLRLRWKAPPRQNWNSWPTAFWMPPAWTIFSSKVSGRKVALPSCAVIPARAITKCGESEVFAAAALTLDVTQIPLTFVF